MNKDNKYLTGYILVISTLILIYILLLIFNGVWQPILISYVIYSIFDNIFSKIKIKQIYVSVIMLITCYGAIIYALYEVLPRIKNVIETIIESIPEITSWLSNIKINVYFEWMINNIFIYLQYVLKSIFQGNSIYSLASYCMVSPLISFYMFSRQEHILKVISNIPHLTEILSNIRYFWQRYIVYQFYVCLAMSLYYCLSMYLCNINHFLLLGIVSGVISFIPYMGFLFGLFITSIICIVNHVSIYYAFLIFLLGQILENIILVPVWIGGSVSGSQLSIIIAMLITNRFLGASGTILSVPLICCAKGIWNWWIKD